MSAATRKLCILSGDGGQGLDNSAGFLLGVGGVEQVAAGNISSAAYASGNVRIVGASEATDVTTHRLV